MVVEVGIIPRRCVAVGRICSTAMLDATSVPEYIGFLILNLFLSFSPPVAAVLVLTKSNIGDEIRALSIEIFSRN